MTVLDVRQMPPRERHPAIFETFDRLEPGAAFVLVNDHDPKPLLYTFQRERVGHYDWSYLETGPERWRVQIARRAAAREGAVGVSDLLGHDHDRLDAVMGELRETWGRGDVAAAAERFLVFRTGLSRHIQAEDDLVFPAFERATGHPVEEGPTAVMRHEHREIEQALSRIQQALDAAEPKESPAVQDLIALLSAHNRKEEHILYPMTDESLDERGAVDLCRAVEAI